MVNRALVDRAVVRAVVGWVAHDGCNGREIGSARGERGGGGGGGREGGAGGVWGLG